MLPNVRNGNDVVAGRLKSVWNEVREAFHEHAAERAERRAGHRGLDRSSRRGLHLIDVPLTKRGADGRRTQRRVLALLLHLGMKRDSMRHEVASLSRMALTT